MVKQSSEISEAGSLIIPSHRYTHSDESAKEGDSVDRDQKLFYLMVAR